MHWLLAPTDDLAYKTNFSTSQSISHSIRKSHPFSCLVMALIQVSCKAVLQNNTLVNLHKTLNLPDISKGLLRECEVQLGPVQPPKELKVAIKTAGNVREFYASIQQASAQHVRACFQVIKTTIFMKIEQLGSFFPSLLMSFTWFLGLIVSTYCYQLLEFVPFYVILMTEFRISRRKNGSHFLLILISCCGLPKQFPLQRICLVSFFYSKCSNSSLEAVWWDSLSVHYIDIFSLFCWSGLRPGVIWNIGTKIPQDWPQGIGLCMQCTDPPDLTISPSFFPCL